MDQDSFLRTAFVETGRFLVPGDFGGAIEGVGPWARFETLSLNGGSDVADSNRDAISEGQIEEAEQDAADPSHEKNPADREDDQSGHTDVNK